MFETEATVTSATEVSARSTWRRIYVWDGGDSDIRHWGFSTEHLEADLCLRRRRQWHQTLRFQHGTPRRRIYVWDGGDSDIRHCGFSTEHLEADLCLRRRRQWHQTLRFQHGTPRGGSMFETRHWGFSTEHLEADLSHGGDSDIRHWGFSTEHLEADLCLRRRRQWHQTLRFQHGAPRGGSMFETEATVTSDTEVSARST